MDVDKSSQLKNSSLTFGSIASIVFRFVWWNTILVIVPLLVFPDIVQLFEEYGIELAWPAEIAVGVGFTISKYRVFYLLFVPFAIIAWQAFLILFSRKRFGSKFILLDWLLLLIATALLLLSLGIPLLRIALGAA